MAILLDAPSTSAVSTAFRILASMGTTAAPTASGIAGSMEIGAAPDGSSALQVTIRGTDPLTYGGQRSELLADPEPTAIRWYAFDIWVPSTFGADRISIMQIHDTPDGGESPVKFPNFEFVVRESKSLEVYVPFDCPSEATSNSRLVGACPLVTDRWVRCVLYCHWQSTTAGWFEAYHDGQLVCSEWWRPFRYTDVTGPYLQIGLYDLFHTGFSGQRRAWYRNIRIGDGAETYASMLGVAPSPRRLAQVPFF